MTIRVIDALGKIARQYPADMVAGQIHDIPRMAFNIFPRTIGRELQERRDM